MKKWKKQFISAREWFYF